MVLDSLKYNGQETAIELFFVGLLSAMQRQEGKKGSAKK